MSFAEIYEHAKTQLFYKDEIENPCEVVEIQNLPQNPLIGSFRNALHSCDVSAKPHGPFLFICIGFFHIR
jgi:hypothetical protein